MKVCIDGHRFDTDKASHYWRLSRMDDRGNHIAGDVYRSSKGTWYVYTPSQWSNMHRWVVMTPDAILDEYGSYLEDAEKEQISQLAGLDFE